MADIASGDNHVVALTDKGEILTFGVAEQGQLGRIDDEQSKFVLSEKEKFLRPQAVTFDANLQFNRIWASNFATFARTTDGKIYSWGLNNYHQLGFPTRSVEGKLILTEFRPTEVPELSAKNIVSICGGTHHTLALDTNGKVYSFGRHHYGRLGHADITQDMRTPRLIATLEDQRVASIACGIDCSFAITESGKNHLGQFLLKAKVLNGASLFCPGLLYSWGMASLHLGHSMPEEMQDDLIVPTRVKSKKLAEAVFLAAASGSQHLVTIVADKKPNGTS